MTIGNILWPFGIIYGLLLLFVVICYIFPILVCLDQEKSGNPDSEAASEIDFEIRTLPVLQSPSYMKPNPIKLTASTFRT
jgi:hypothetical protein